MYTNQKEDYNGIYTFKLIFFNNRLFFLKDECVSYKQPFSLNTFNIF